MSWRCAIETAERHGAKRCAVQCASCRVRSGESARDTRIIEELERAEELLHKLGAGDGVVAARDAIRLINNMPGGR